MIITNKKYYYYNYIVFRSKAGIFCSKEEAAEKSVSLL